MDNKEIEILDSNDTSNNNEVNSNAISESNEPNNGVTTNNNATPINNNIVNNDINQINVPPVSNDSVSFSYGVLVDALPSEKKKGKKGLIIGITIASVLILIVGGLFIYKETVLLNKKTIIKNSIVEAFNALESGVDTLNENMVSFDANEESIGLEGSIQASSTFKSDYVDLTKLGNYIFKYNTVLDLKNNKMSRQFNLNKSNNPLLSLTSNINGKYAVVQSKELSYYAYSFNLDREIKEIKLNNRTNCDKLKNIISRTKDYVASRVNEDKITKETVEETINGNKSNYTKFTYNVNLTELTNDVLKFYITDISVLNTIAEITSMDANKLKSIIQEMISENTSDYYVNFEIYVDSLFGKFKQLKMYNVNSSDKYFVLYEVNGGYQYQLIGEIKVNGKYSDNNFTLESDYLKLGISKINDGEYKILYTIDDDYSSITIDADYKSTIENDKQNISMNINYKHQSKDSGRQTIAKEENSDFDFNIKVDTSIYKNASVTPLSAFIVKDINTIDDNEFSDIYQRLQTIIEKISNDIFVGYSNSFDNLAF